MTPQWHVTPQWHEAMEALRAWSAPGRRADLIAAAWRAGEHSVNALAEAARVARQTVYTDLARRGINPTTDRQEPPVPTPLTLGPFSGVPTDKDASRRLAEIFNEFDEARHQGIALADRDNGPEERDLIDARSRNTELALHQWQVVRYHNTLIEYAARELEAREAAARALQRVESAWVDLDTATAWRAAHHRYVVAVHAARAALNAWVAASDELAATDKELRRTLNFVAKGAYERLVPDAAARIVVDADAAKLELQAMEERHAERRAIAAETLGRADDN